MRRNPAALRRWHGYEVGEGLQAPAPPIAGGGYHGSTGLRQVLLASCEKWTRTLVISSTAIYEHDAFP